MTRAANPPSYSPLTPTVRARPLPGISSPRSALMTTSIETALIERDLDGAAWSVVNVKETERQRHPDAPFTTSTLQQEASRKLGYQAKRTMVVAQQLYEGIAVGGGEAVGLITYMRTHSANVASLAHYSA